MKYKVPFVNYPLQYERIRDEVDRAVTSALAGGEFILREETKRFEESMADLLDVERCVGVNSGTDALILSLLAAGIGPGDEVITVAHTYVASIAAIVHAGGTPVLVDVGDDMNMDVGQVEEAVTSKTKAVMPVHLNGRMCDMTRLMEVTAKHGLIVIEDAAQALTATCDGKKAGSFGLASGFSFYPAKVLGAAGDAGLIATSDPQLAEEVWLLRDHGRKTKDELACFGFNTRLDNVQAAILNVKLKYVTAWVQRRREIADLYYEGLSDVPGVKLPPRPDERFQDVYQNYVLRVAKRDELAAYLRESGIEVIISNPIPVHHQEQLGLSRFHLPNTERLAQDVISIPNIPELSNDQVQYVIDRIRSFYTQ